MQQSGWLQQGGFEIHLRDGSTGSASWNIYRGPGAPWGIGPGGLDWRRRMESRVLSYGGGRTDPWAVRVPGFRQSQIVQGGRKVGDLTTCVCSLRVRKTIGFAPIDKARDR